MSVQNGQNSQRVIKSPEFQLLTAYCNSKFSIPKLPMFFYKLWLLSRKCPNFTLKLRFPQCGIDDKLIAGILILLLAAPFRFSLMIALLIGFFTKCCPCLLQIIHAR